jgi:hypothetical protein
MDQKYVRLLALMIFIIVACSNSAEKQSIWIKIDDGMHYSEFSATPESGTGNSKILVVRIDPGIYDCILLSASEQTGGETLNVKEWSNKYGLIVVTNAGMFQKDFKSNVGYMKNYNHFNNPRIHKTYASVFAFNPKHTGLYPARIFDIDTDKMKEIIDGYHTVIQNLRLIKRPGENRWLRPGRKWSEAALGQDQDNNILFIFSEYPHSMHDLGNILLELPIKVVSVQHLEGGSAASFYLRHNKTEIIRSGCRNVAPVGVNSESPYLPIPNVIGIKKRK